jgi:hypothetical protein
MTTPIPWKGFNPDHPSEYARAARYTGQILADREWHGWRELHQQVATECPKLQPKTIDVMLRQMVSHGSLQRRCWYSRCRDTRMVRRSDER